MDMSAIAGEWRAGCQLIRLFRACKAQQAAVGIISLSVPARCLTLDLCRGGGRHMWCGWPSGSHVGFCSNWSKGFALVHWRGKRKT